MTVDVVSGHVDFAPLLPLIEAAWTIEWGGDVGAEEKLRRYEESHDPEKDHTFVLKDEARAVGFARYSAFPRDDVDTRTAHIYDIVILKEYRGRGFARDLMQRMVDHSREGGFTTILSRSMKSNDASLGLHASMGFTVSFETEDSVVWELKA